MHLLHAYWRKAPIQFCMSCFVIACHLFFFAYLLSAKKEPARKSREHRIVVKTKNHTSSPLASSPLATSSLPTSRPAARTAAQPAKSAAAASSKPTQQHPAKQAVKPVAPQAKPQTAPQPKPQTTVKSPVPKGKTSTTVQTKLKTPMSQKVQPKGRPKVHKEQLDAGIPTISTELVQQLQESIAKIEKKPDKYRAEQRFVLPEKPGPMPEPVQGRMIGPANASGSIEYRHDFLAGIKEELIAHLHMALHLPDFGEVKVQLELSENGNVQTVKVLKSGSQKNREYLEKELPRMSFSYIAGHKLSAKERTFVISFHNEM